MDFPPNFAQKVRLLFWPNLPPLTLSDTQVDMRKVELAVMKPWIAQKINALLGFEDEVVIEYVTNLLEDEANPVSFSTVHLCSIN